MTVDYSNGMSARTFEWFVNTIAKEAIESNRTPYVTVTGEYSANAECEISFRQTLQYQPPEGYSTEDDNWDKNVWVARFTVAALTENIKGAFDTHYRKIRSALKKVNGAQFGSSSDSVK